jgi:hypothetical protein
MAGEQFDDPNREAVGLEPIWSTDDDGGGGEGGITTPTLTAATPNSIPFGEESTFTVTGTGFEVGIEFMYKGIANVGVYTRVDDTTVTWTWTPFEDEVGTGQITARNRPDPEASPGPTSNALPFTVTAAGAQTSGGRKPPTKRA